MSLNTFKPAPPNLCCKHVPTDSLKELIAPNNLTIWFQKYIPLRLLALRSWGLFRCPQRCCGAERQREGEVARLARRLKRGGDDKDHHLLPVFLVSDPGRQWRPWISMIRVRATAWNVIQREDEKKRKAASKKEKKEEIFRAGGSRFSIIMSLFLPLCVSSSFAYH